MFIARKGDTTTLGPKGRQTYEPSGRRPVHLKNPHTAGVPKGASRPPLFTHISKCYAIHKSFHTGGSDELYRG